MRKRTGTIQLRGDSLQARHTITVDGVAVRRWFPLGTDSWAVARGKNKLLTEQLARGEIPSVEATSDSETCAAAFARIIPEMRKEGLKSWKDKDQRLRDYALPLLGPMKVDAVKASHIREALDRCKAAGKSKQTVVHVRNALSSVFEELVGQGVVRANPVAAVKTPKFPTEEDRPRQILTDDEFAQFVTCEEVSLLLRGMGMTSRVFGGMRTGDLHAWRWEHINLSTWATAKIKRPKTRGLSVIELPELLKPWLQRWWNQLGAPTAGPVFPVGRGLRANEHRGHTGYARQLRAALELAGIERSELFANGEESLRVDFHSFRRAYASALADSGINAQQAMKLAGHSKIETHMRYVDRLKPMATPESIVPSLGRFDVNPAGRTGLEPAASGVTERQFTHFFRVFSTKLVADRPHFRGLFLPGRLAWTIPAGTPVEVQRAATV